MKIQGLRVGHVTVLMAFMLGGCATPPTRIDSARSADLRLHGLAVNGVTGQSDITINTKAQKASQWALAAGGVVGGAVGGAAAGAVVGATGPTPKGSTDGSSAPPPQPLDTPAHVMAARLSSAMSPATDNLAAYRIDIQQKEWLLEYDNLFGPDNYRLHWDVRAKLLDLAGGVLWTTQCDGESEHKSALEDWLANDFSKVKAAGRDIGERCADQMMSDIGLRDGSS